MASTPTLLVIDGHERVCHALAERLRRAPGLGAVHSAGTLHEALTLARAHAPPVVIYDPRTVGGNIAEAARHLRREIAYVVVLATSLLDYERVLLEVGVSAVLFKGITEGLLAAVAALAAQ